MNLHERATGHEIMDDLNCHGDVVAQTLRELDFINRWLGGNAITLQGIFKVIEQSKQKKLRIADMGCGSGELLQLIYQRALRQRYQVELVGIDANPHIVRYASERVAPASPITFQSKNVLSPSFQQETFDIITATLFTHHFTDDELVALLKNWAQQARLAVVINDLHRHFLAYHSIRLLTWLFSKSAMVKYDAPLSVRKGFTRKELEMILKRAGIRKYRLSWRWAFRWQLIIIHT